MDTTESENDVTKTEATLNETKKIKRQRAPWRTITLDDGTTKYNSKPFDPEYFKKYYIEKRKESESLIITCERCGRSHTTGHTTRHQKSKYCVKKYNEQIIPLLS